MLNKLSWRRCTIWAGVLLVACLAAWSFRATPPAPIAVQRADLDLRDGRLYLRNAPAPFAGLLIEDWRPGQRRTEISIRDGQAHGVTRGWFENGQREVEEYFVRGVSHGPRTRWHENGARRSEVKVRDGKLAGVFREWHPNGRLARETPLRDGVPHGEVRSWDAQGKLTGTARVEHGKRVARD